MARETFEQLVARINATAFLHEDNASTPAAKPVKAKDLPRTVRGVLKLPRDQQEMLLRLIEGRAFVVSVEGAQYAAWRDGESWAVRRLDCSTPKHTVSPDGSCTCADYKFRAQKGDPAHRCKHYLAMERAVLRG